MNNYSDRSPHRGPNICHCTIQTSHSDSAYSSMYSNSCGRNDETLTLTSSDENLQNELYDADDEIDRAALERTEKERTGIELTEEKHEHNPTTKLRAETDHLFCFSQSDLGPQNIVYSLDRAMEIIKERPKLTERLSNEDDSDDCFRESEYDVIDSDEDLNITDSVNGTTFSTMTMPVITVRSYDSPDEGIVEIIAGCKKKQRVGKVRSLPNMRFPLRKKYDECNKRTSVCTENIHDKYRHDDYKFRHSLSKYNSSDDSGDVVSSTKIHTFPRRGKSRNGTLIHENDYNKRHIRCYDLFKRPDHHEVEQSGQVIQSYTCTNFTVPGDSRMGRFQICHISEKSPNHNNMTYET